MIFNSERKAVWHNDAQLDNSWCPECGGPLIAKMGDIVVWHWAHHPGGVGRDCPNSGLSQWHMRWSLAFDGTAGWEIEISQRISGNVYRYDAYHPSGCIVEFVHSLSDKYLGKHRMLLAGGFNDLAWIFDGSEFISAHAKPCSRGGICKMLKPKVLRLVEEIGNSHAYIHHDGTLWRQWKPGANVFYRADYRWVPRFCGRFDATVIPRIGG